MRYWGIFWLCSTGLASAATHSVQADGSGDFLSIQAALDAASSGDVVEVGPGTYQEALQLGAVPLTLRSTAGAEDTVLDGGDAPAVLKFVEGTSASVLVEGFTLVNAGGRGMTLRSASPTLVGIRMEGLGSSEIDGGAVWIQGGSPSFEDCEFRGNFGALGGAVYVENAELLLKDCSFDENEAEQGGALYGEGVVLWDVGGEYDFNIAEESGGAIRLNGPVEASFDSGRFWSNFTSNNGGAVATYGTTEVLEFKNVSFISNESYWNGGAVSSEYAYNTVLFEACHLDSNDGVYDYGAGIYAAYYSGVALVDTVIENHRAYYQGGGVYQYYGGDFRCEDSLIEDNFASTVGGGVRLRDFYSHGEVMVDGCSFVENESEYEGGGLAIEDTNTIRIENTQFARNEAGGDFPGGGLLILRADQAHLANNHFVANSAGFGGGAVLEESDPLLGPYILSNNSFVENVASYGGGLMLTETPRPKGKLDYGGIWSNKEDVSNRFVLSEDPAAPEGDWIASMEWDYTEVTEDDVTSVFYTPTLALPEVMPSLFRLDVYSPHLDWGLTVRFRDIEGEYFYGWYGDADWTGWREIEVGGVENWGSWGGDDDKVIDLPIRELQFEIYSDAGHSGIVSVDNVRIETESDGEILLAGFEQADWPLGLYNNSFLANYGLEDGAALLVWEAVADFRNNLVLHSGGSLGVSLMDAESLADWAMSHNGFYQNQAGDVSEGLSASDSLVGEPRFAAYSQDGELSNDRLVFLDGSPFRDAGDPDLLDPDGSRSDLGANGGPGALWMDQDQDGYTSGYDCDDLDASVYPGAVDTPYDGINQDCSWGSDFDQDGDGEEALEHGGTDCDDMDAALQEGCDSDEDTGEPPTDEEPASCGCSSVSPSGSGVSLGWLFFAAALCRSRRAGAISR